MKALRVVKSFYYIGFEMAFFGGVFQKNFSVPIHWVDVLGQRLLLQQAPSNGHRYKVLYSIGFEKGIFLVSDKIFLRVFKLCLLHRRRSFVTKVC